MKFRFLAVLFLSQVAFVSCLCGAPTPMGSGFLYHGQLMAGGVATNGNYDFQFSLFDAATNGNQIGATLTSFDVPLTNGYFSALIDFGAGAFAGNASWLAMSVRTNGGGNFTPLYPLQPIYPAPTAVFATTASNSTGPVSLGQLPSAVVTNNSIGVSLVGVFTGNGAGLTNLQQSNVLGQVASSNLPVLTEAQSSLPFGMMQESSGMPAKYQGDIYRLPPMVIAPGSTAAPP